MYSSQNESIFVSDSGGSIKNKCPPADDGQIEDTEHGFTHRTDWVTSQIATSGELGEIVHPYHQTRTLQLNRDLSNRGIAFAANAAYDVRRHQTRRKSPIAVVAVQIKSRKMAF